MKKLFLLGAMVCALGMMTACKSGTMDKTTSGTSKPADVSLIGEWETVSAEEISLDSTEIKRLDSADYMYYSFEIDEETISYTTRTLTPPFEKKVVHVGYSISNDTVTFWYGATDDIVPMWKIVELTPDKFVFIDECYVEDGLYIPTYTMERK